MTNELRPLFDDDGIAAEILSRSYWIPPNDGYGHQWLSADDAIETMKVVRDSYEARIADLESLEANRWTPVPDGEYEYFGIKDDGTTLTTTIWIDDDGGRESIELPLLPGMAVCRRHE